MSYSQEGLRQPLQRCVNYSPGSYAFFEVACLSKGCVMGGFDFTQILNSIVNARLNSFSGDMTCGGGPVSDHSAVNYAIRIDYFK